MKANDFSYYVHKFLVDYLPNERGSSTNTIETYRYTFMLLLEFLSTKGINPEKVKIENITRKLILDFLDWLENDRKSSISTRNNRLACIFSFCRFLQYDYPDYLNNYVEILNIKLKKAIQPTVPYIDIEGMKLLMKQPNRKNDKENRDYFILLILYESAIRVSELINLKISSFHITKPYYIKILGKGNKERLVPVNENVVNEFNKYIKRYSLENEPIDHLLIFNTRGEAFSRVAINNILKKYINRATENGKYNYPVNVTPHILRHSKAMHLLQAGVNLVYIRDILGHTSIQTTEIYARADSKKKQEAIEAAYQNIYPDDKAKWKNKNILDWLKSF